MSPRARMVVLRWLLTAALAALLASWVDWGRLREVIGRTDLARAALSGSLFAVTLVATSIRWWLILRAAGLAAPLGGVFRLTWAGMFFALFLPGGTGGDIVRGVMTARETSRKGGAVATIVVDRVLGMWAILTVGFVGCLLLWGREGMVRPTILMAGLLGGSMVSAAVYFIPALRRSPPARWLVRKLPGIAHLRDADAVFQAMAAKPAIPVAGIGLSLVTQVVHMTIMAGVASAIGMNVPATALFAVGPLIIVANALPISIGGWGVGETAAWALLAPLGAASEEAVALMLVYRACVIAISLPGALLFAAGRARPGLSREADDPAATGPAAG